ncbi:hypothetical protein EDC04DRAFT_2616204 [Pisolithus marmoratus]|nr:hypothetical protein EDC04DRAFT_2616204 [Pisolithus marmoratus]
MSASESVMENAIAEGLATVLHNILPKISGTLQPFPNCRRMPHRKRNEDREVALEKATEPSQHRDFILAEVHHLFKARLYITQDVDFITHKPASPKVAATGHLETLGEVKACLINEQTQTGKESRQATCQHNWLGCLIRTLGEHGMSSEESAVENGVENILHGSHPLHRIHATKNLTTKQDAVKGLLIALYDGAWIASLTEHQKESLEISTTLFPWMKVAVM